VIVDFVGLLLEGWIKTFERYFEEQTRNILNFMVDKLEQYPQMRFIYAEMSFFSLWWSQIDPTMRQRVKKLVGISTLFRLAGNYVWMLLILCVSWSFKLSCSNMSLIVISGYHLIDVFTCCCCCCRDDPIWQCLYGEADAPKR